MSLWYLLTILSILWIISNTNWSETFSKGAIFLIYSTAAFSQQVLKIIMVKIIEIYHKNPRAYSNVRNKQVGRLFSGFSLKQVLIY